jgi:hypothetical protein
LPWSWARERLETAPTYWVTTVSPEGFPHSRPVWGVWRQDGFWFSTQNRSIDHIAKNPRASLNIQDDNDIIVVEGHCDRIVGVDGISVMVDGYAAKYSWETTAEEEFIVRPDAVATVYRLAPDKIFGWPFDNWESITRWSFPPSA